MDKLKAFHDRYLVLEPVAGIFSNEKQMNHWSSKELDPVPHDLKKWEWYHVGGYWIAEGFTATQLQTASASITLGLNPGLALLAYFIGDLIVAVACCASGYIGSKYSINFPVFARASFGLRGSYLAVVIRAVIAPMWFGIQVYNGSLGVQSMLEAIWPSFNTWQAGSLPSNANVDAPGILSFAILWVVFLPFLWISVQALRWVFLAKIILMPVFGIVLFTWALTASNGFGPLFTIPTRPENGQSVGYLFCYAITSAISGSATFTLSMPDITRYAHNPRSSTLAQAVGLPVCITLTYFLGVVMAASSQVLYGTIYWNPLDIVKLWTNRPAKFFAGLLFTFAAIGNNVAGNSVPFANDTMALFPRYVNIRRGQYLCAVIAFAVCPWNIEANATRFLAFLNGYSIFLGPIVAVLLTDYFAVRRAKDFNIYHLYKPQGTYWYQNGFNWRAIVAFLAGMFPLLPGLMWQINPQIAVSEGYINFNGLSWLESVVFASLTYYVLYRLFPITVAIDEEDKAAWAIVKRQTVTEQLPSGTPEEQHPVST